MITLTIIGILIGIILTIISTTLITVISIMPSTQKRRIWTHISSPYTNYLHHKIHRELLSKLRWNTRVRTPYLIAVSPTGVTELSLEEQTYLLLDALNIQRTKISTRVALLLQISGLIVATRMHSNPLYSMLKWKVSELGIAEHDSSIKPKTLKAVTTKYLTDGLQHKLHYKEKHNARNKKNQR